MALMLGHQTLGLTRVLPATLLIYATLVLWEDFWSGGAGRSRWSG